MLADCLTCQACSWIFSKMALRGRHYHSESEEAVPLLAAPHESDAGIKQNRPSPQMAGRPLKRARVHLLLLEKCSNLSKETSAYLPGMQLLLQNNDIRTAIGAHRQQGCLPGTYIKIDGCKASLEASAHQAVHMRTCWSAKLVQ